MTKDKILATLIATVAEPIGNVGNDSVKSNHEASLLVIRALFGWVSRSDKFIEALEAAVASEKALALLGGVNPREDVDESIGHERISYTCSPIFEPCCSAGLNKSERKWEQIPGVKRFFYRVPIEILDA